MPKDLLESELFGHERGSFTGAQAQRRGRFEQAEGGTLFLDEIGDMPADLQTRLLRVLSDGSFYRVGGHQQIKTNVRVIAATHQNLDARVREGSFREDLYHRLNVIRIRLPAMRERREDIPLLARHFLAHSATQLGVDPKRLSDAVVEHIARLDFPGNVRQLENLCHWLTVMSPAQVVQVQDLPREVLAPAASAPVSANHASHGGAAAPHDAPGAHEVVAGSSPTRAAAAPGNSTSGEMAWVADLQREARRRLEAGEPEVWETLNALFEGCLITTALDVTHGRRIEAAVKLGIGRNTLTRKIKELELKV